MGGPNAPQEDQKQEVFHEAAFQRHLECRRPKMVVSACRRSLARLLQGHFSRVSVELKGKLLVGCLGSIRSSLLANRTLLHHTKRSSIFNTSASRTISTFQTWTYVLSYFCEDTFHSDVQVNSVHIPDTRSRQQQFVKEGQSGGSYKPSTLGSLSEGYGESYLTTMSLHINHQHGQKRGIGKKLLQAVRTRMLPEHGDLVAGDANGAAFRRQSGNEQRYDSTIDEAFSNTSLPTPPGPHPHLCGDQVAYHVSGPMFVVSSSHVGPKPNGVLACTLRFKIQLEILGIEVTDESCHRKNCDGKYRRPSGRKRKSPCRLDDTEPLAEHWQGPRAVNNENARCFYVFCFIHFPHHAHALVC